MNTTRFRVAFHNLDFSILLVVLFLALNGCSSGYGGGGGGGNAPYISGLSVASGPVGTAVTITGTHFGATQGSSTVTFNGTAASPTTWSDTSIAAPVPSGATTGSVVVTVGGVASNGSTFTVTSSSSTPTITSLSPTSGPVGTSVTITGTNFRATQGSSTVTFYNNQTAAVSSWSATSIVVTVPTGAATGNVDVTVNGIASNGVTFTVTTMTASKFPIKLSTNKRYFVDQNNTPWLMVMDAAHHLMPVIGSTQSSIAQYMNSRASLGFTAVNIYGACGGTGTCPASGAAQNGQLPFLIGNQNTNYDLCGTSTPPCTSPNPAYWSQVDAVISAAANAGLVVLFDPLPWNVNFGSAMENLTGPVNYPANDFNFGVWLGNRYKSFPNIIWQFGQDFRHGALPDLNFMDYMAQVIAGVASVDTNHLITAQMNFYVSYTQQGYQVACNTQCTTGVFWNPRFGNAMNVSFVYTYYETYDEVLQAYNCGPGGSCTIQASNGTNSIGGSSGTASSNQIPPATMPVILGEANYENANNTGLLQVGGVATNANAFITRLQNWYSMTSGGAGFEFGNANVTHFDSSPLWSTQLNTPATQQVQYLASLFKQFNWWTLIPDQTHQIVTGGFGTPNPSNANLYTAGFATTAYIPSGSQATLSITYTPVGTNMLSVNMGMYTKAMSASWFDPTTGMTMTIGSFTNSGSQTFTPPTTAHSDGTHDWVLILQ
ncbi:MAG TPA: DUF4038 domain-containing protein [Candidatus Acidoferrum sp.]